MTELKKQETRSSTIQLFMYFALSDQSEPYHNTQCVGILIVQQKS